MPRNRAFFPTDFPLNKRGSGSNATNSFDSAVNLLSINARDTSIRQVHSRRVAAQGNINNQNKIVPSFHTLIPSHVIGKQLIGNTIIGSVAFIPGSTGLQVFSFSNEIFRRSTVKLSQHLRYVSITGNSESGKIGGGLDWNGVFSEKFDKIKYFPNETVTAAIARLSEPRIAAIGQMGNALNGIIAGGSNRFGILQKSSHIYNHGTDTITNVNNFLQTARFAPHGGLSSRYAGYVMGGSNTFFGGAAFKTIEKSDYADPMTPFTLIATTLSHSHVVHAAFGNDLKGYLLGGSNANPVESKWTSDAITRFTYSGEQATLLSLKLPYELTCSFGCGSSEAGFIFTGWVGEGFNNGLNNLGVFKLRFSDEQSFLIDTMLLEEAWDTGAVSDYSPGYSYN